jgi:hypothetical protein
MIFTFPFAIESKLQQDILRLNKMSCLVSNFHTQVLSSVDDFCLSQLLLWWLKNIGFFFFNSINLYSARKSLFSFIHSSLWTQTFQFYTMDCDSLLSEFTLMFNLSLIWLIWAFAHWFLGPFIIALIYQIWDILFLSGKMAKFRPILFCLEIFGSKIYVLLYLIWFCN